MKKLPDQDFLLRCLRYNKRTGELRWRNRPVEHFKSSWAWQIWNFNYADRPAFTYANAFGHLTGRLNGQAYLAHRIIWKMVTGKDPENLIDHQDRTPSNRWKNLRAATKSQNNINSVIKQGVHFDKARGRWAAYIKKDGKRKYLGRFATKRKAKRIRIIAARDMFGVFAP